MASNAQAKRSNRSFSFRKPNKRDRHITDVTVQKRNGYAIFCAAGYRIRPSDASGAVAFLDSLGKDSTIPYQDCLGLKDFMTKDKPDLVYGTPDTLSAKALHH